MSISIREQLLAAITLAVGGEYGIAAPEDERDLPVTIVQDDQDSAGYDYQTARKEMPITVARAALATSSDREILRAEANELLAAIEVEMTADETFGGLADEAELIGGVISSEVGKWVGAQAFFTVRYHHLRGDPYTIE